MSAIKNLLSIVEESELKIVERIAIDAIDLDQWHRLPLSGIQISACKSAERAG
ncbi:MAG: hypothetical protein M0P19_13145 [Nevskia sp.]|jgi:hypothetical protein|nr:hypothetical protein [Nevskia sp.]MCK9386629.1 hypothetical protein [Nevskia sp.]